MAKYKPIRFYYHACYDGDDALDLTTIFDRVSTLYENEDEKYTFKISDVYYTLERLKRPTDSNNFYHIVVEELRDFNFPTRTRVGGASLDLDLAEDEFLGERMSALYDGNNHIFMLQVNRNSISTTKFELFLSSVLEKMGNHIDLRLPVILQQDAERVANSFTEVKSIAVGLNQSSNIHGTFDIFSAFRPQIGPEDSELFDATIILKAKKDSNGKQFLPDSIAHEVLAYDRAGMKKLEIRGRNDSSSRLETVDIIENKLIDVINFSYSEEGRTLRPDSVFEEMKQKYSESIHKVLRNI